MVLKILKKLDHLHCAIIRGNPAEVIKYRDKEIFWKLYNEGKFA